LSDKRNYFQPPGVDELLGRTVVVETVEAVVVVTQLASLRQTAFVQKQKHWLQFNCTL